MGFPNPVLFLECDLGTDPLSECGGRTDFSFLSMEFQRDLVLSPWANPGPGAGIPVASDIYWCLFEPGLAV